MSRARIWMLGALILGRTLSARAQTTQWATGAYVYDGAGNIKSIGNTEQYRYDASGRLTSGTIATGQTQTVTYDPYGNIKTITTAGSALAVGVDPATNRATQTHEAQTNTAYNVYGTYDLAGRLTSALNGAGGTYSYDALDSVMKSGNGVTKVHWYTASDERIASVAVVNNNGTWLETESEWTLRDPSGKVLRRLQRTGTQWSWKQDYIYAGSQLLAAETDTPARTLHFFPDHLGTARLITANGGTKVAFHTYYPFGDEATASSQDSEKLEFTGHERDAANLDYMHARYYAPKWGRFLSVDPNVDVETNLSEPQRWNRYAYVTNNPLKYSDPDGRERLQRYHFKNVPVNDRPSSGWEMPMLWGAALVGGPAIRAGWQMAVGYFLGNPNAARHLTDGALAPPGVSALPSPEQIGAAIGSRVAGQATGKMAAIAGEISGMKMTQAGAAAAVDSAVQATGLRTTGVMKVGDNLVIGSVAPGANKPVMVVDAQGAVRQASATVEVTKKGVIIKDIEYK